MSGERYISKECEHVVDAHESKMRPYRQRSKGIRPRYHTRIAYTTTTRHSEHDMPINAIITHNRHAMIRHIFQKRFLRWFHIPSLTGGLVNRCVTSFLDRLYSPRSISDATAFNFAAIAYSDPPSVLDSAALRNRLCSARNFLTISFSRSGTHVQGLRPRSFPVLLGNDLGIFFYDVIDVGPMSRSSTHPLLHFVQRSFYGSSRCSLVDLANFRAQSV